VLPGIEKDPADWIGRYGKVALTGKPERFESYSEALGKWYSVSAFSPHRGFFAVTFTDITERKNMQAQLQASEQRWATTLASIGDAVIATDTNGKITFMNAVAEDLTGWTLREASGQPVSVVFNIINEKSRQAVENPILKVLRKGGVAGLANHTLLIRKDGTEIPIDDSGAPIKNPGGVTTGVVLVFRDITDRKRMEDELNEQTIILNTVMANTGAMLVYLDRDFNFIMANKAYLGACGHTWEEVKGKNHFSLFPDGENEAIFRKVINTGEAVSFHDKPFEYGDQPRRGVTYWDWTLVPIKDNFNVVIGLVFSLIETTERKKAEAELLAANMELNAIYANAPIAIMLVDRDRRVRKVNEAAADFSRRQTDEMIGLRGGEALRCLYSLDDPRGCGFGPSCEICTIRHAVTDTFDKGIPQINIEAKFPRNIDGTAEDRWLQISTAIIRADSKDMVLLCAEDITERKKAERLKDEFIGMVSHELKTPLTVIMGSLATAMDQRIAAEDARELLDAAVGHAGILANIVDNLLELSRQQSDRLVLQTKEVNVGEITQNVLRNLGSKSDIHQLVADIPSNLAPAKADPFRVERILYNLVDNAIKYSPNGGEVKVTAHQNGDFLTLGVVDQGPGISADDQVRLFQSFERLGATVKGAIQGTGLGLRVCRILAEAHGGRIWVESEKGNGSTFLFTLPIAKP
jgi:PAS domain S-box-containing protein